MIINPFVFGGGGGGGSAHRYWRLLITAADGTSGYMGVSELEFLNSDGEPFNIPTSATSAMFGSGQLNSGNAIAFAFDRLYQNGWLSATDASPQHVGFDFEGTGASPSAPVEVRGVRIWGSWNIPNASPKDFAVQWSDDGTNWTTHFSVTGATGWAGQEMREFYDGAWTGVPIVAPPSAVSYWRIMIAEVQAGTVSSVSIGEIEMRATVGGADQCAGGTASASTTFSGFPASQAFDNDPNTRWASNANMRAWIQYEFPAPVDVAQILIRSPDAGNYASGQMPREFSLQWSSDGVTFKNAYIAPTQGSAWAASTDNLFTV